jgi:hypothetical protein
MRRGPGRKGKRSGAEREHHWGKGKRRRARLSEHLSPGGEFGEETLRRARSVVRAGGLVWKMWGGRCHVVLAHPQSWEDTVIGILVEVQVHATGVGTRDSVVEGDLCRVEVDVVGTTRQPGRSLSQPCEEVVPDLACSGCRRYRSNRTRGGCRLEGVVHGRAARFARPAAALGSWVSPLFGISIIVRMLSGCCQDAVRMLSGCCQDALPASWGGDGGRKQDQERATTTIRPHACKAATRVHNSRQRESKHEWGCECWSAPARARARVRASEGGRVGSNRTAVLRLRRLRPG